MRFIAMASARKITTAMARTVHCPLDLPNPNHCTLSGVHEFPLSRHTQRFRHVTIVASVTTIDGKPSHAMSAPLIEPKITPIPIDASNTTIERKLLAASRPAHTLQMANCEATEISI